MPTTDELLNGATPCLFSNEEEQNAYRYLINQKEQHPGISDGEFKAAIFDLIVGAGYYTMLSLSDWIYCPADHPAIVMPFVNCCPRCVAKGEFKHCISKKPASGRIGKLCSEVLGKMILSLSQIRGHNQLTIYSAAEPVDLIIHDAHNRFITLAEIKSAPLFALPLLCPTSILTETQSGELCTINEHRRVNIFSDTKLSVFLPDETGTRSYEIGSFENMQSSVFTLMRFVELSRSTDFLARYMRCWKRIWDSYCLRNSSDALFWFSGGCGAPRPVPADWPHRISASGGPESISDAKTSVGCDRTDDIKKAVYQLMKIRREVAAPDRTWTLNIVILSNTHAARHEEEYVNPIKQIIWTTDETYSARKAGDLPIDTPLFGVFDGLLTFTKSHTRNEYLDTLL